MKRRKKLYVMAVILVCMILAGQTAEELVISAASRGAEPIRPQQYQQMLGKGMDVDWSKTGAGRRNYSEIAVKKLKKAGISHVRIRVKDTVPLSLFQYLDQQISDCIKNDMIPVLAYQADEFKNSVSDQSMEEAVKWWSAVAEHYKDYSYLLSFDLLIECSDALNKQPQKLNEYFEKAVSAVRVTNPQRIIMISPRVRSDAAYLSDLEIPTQANGFLMAEWHFYASGPSKTNDRKLWTTGTKAEKKRIQDKIDLALDWQEKTGIPTWVGAWMAGNYNAGNEYSIEEQVKFAHYMVSRLEAAHIPFAVNSDTKFYNRKTDQWIESMLPLRYCIYNSHQDALRALFCKSQCKVTSVKKASESSIQVRWSKLKRADKYQLVISVSSDFNKAKKLYTVSGLTKTIQKLRPGRVYYIKVRGCGKISDKKVYSRYSTAGKIKL